MIIKHLSSRLAESGIDYNEIVLFFDSLKLGDVFTYGEAWDVERVKEAAAEEYWEVIYCKPFSEEYKKYGCHTMKVIGIDSVDGVRIREFGNHLEFYPFTNTDFHSVKLYKPRDEFGELTPAVVNWSALGETSPDEAIKYAEAIIAAAKWAKESA